MAKSKENLVKEEVINMSDAIKCRCRRYFRSNDSECWSIEHDEDEGFVSEDVLVLQFTDTNDELVKALYLSKSEERINSEEILSYLLAIFEDLTNGEGSFTLKRQIDEHIEDYWPEDLVKKLNEI